MHKKYKSTNNNVEGSETKWIRKLKELFAMLKTANSMMNQITVTQAQSALVTELQQAFPTQPVKHLNAVKAASADNHPLN